MKKIFIYRISSLDINADNIACIEAPVGAEFLSVQYQPWSTTIAVWMLVDPSISNTETHKFLIVGTGWDVDSESNKVYRGTVQMPDTQTVWHIFELV